MPMAERRLSRSHERGRRQREPQRARLRFWSSGSGMTVSDAAAAQLLAVCARGVGLIAAQRLGCGPCSTGPQTLDAQFGQQPGELGRVAGLARGHRDDQRPAAPVDEQVGLGGQPPRERPIAWSAGSSSRR